MDTTTIWTIIGSSAGVVALIYMFLRNFKIDVLHKFDKIDQKFDKIDQRFDKVDQRFDKVEEKITDIDRRLCRLEGAFSSKEFCRIQDERQMKKAE